jgi:hypothetical protein
LEKQERELKIKEQKYEAVARQHGFVVEERDDTGSDKGLVEEKSKMDKRLMHGRLELGLA